jgi:hypothetical protein
MSCLCRRVSGLLLLTGLLLAVAPVAWADSWSGTVQDATSTAPIAGAVVTRGDQQAMTDETGHFTIAGSGTFRVRALGYRRQELVAASEATAPRILKLQPITPKALYLSIYGIGVAALREPAFATMTAAGLNAIVIDLKGDGGQIPYASQMPLAAQTGALKVRMISDLPGLVASLKARGLYTIARIVVFKDPLLAAAKPGWAVHNGDGSVWTDTSGLAWIDPFQKPSWDYAIGVAEEAAAAGFDEVQFDYIRFPDTRAASYAQPATQANRIATIDAFLQTARTRLQRYNVFLGVDIFGYVCWNSNDTDIGQKLEDLGAMVDYISPMLYPSGFQFGIPGHRDPVADPYAIVYESLQRAQERLAGQKVRLRPWLQAFRDYAFDKRQFGDAEIRAQIKASADAKAIGWMLWNPRNVYSTDGLLEKQAASKE